MKMILMTLATVLVIAGNVQAKTICAVATTSKDQNNYDRMLAQVDLTENKFVLVARDGNSAREIDFKEYNTPEKWHALDGHLIAGFTKTAENQFSLIVGKIDIKAENSYSLIALSVGNIQDKGFLVLMAPAQKLSLSCYQNAQ